MSKPYCGSNPKPPKNKHLATEDECIKAGQVRRYGVLEVNERKLQLSKINPEKEKIKLFGIKGKIIKVEDMIDTNDIQIKRDKVTKDKKDKLREINKILTDELKELKSKEKERILLLREVKNEKKEKKEVKKDSDDIELTKDNLKLLAIRYKTRYERIEKELEHKKDDKDLLKEKEKVMKKYNKYKELYKSSS